MDINFITVHTKDMKKSIDFYQDVMGFKIKRQFSPRPGMEITFLGDDQGPQMEFIKNDNEPVYAGSGLSVGFYVADMDKTVEHLKKHGVEVIHGPVTMNNGTKLLNVKDINGLELGFVQQ